MSEILERSYEIRQFHGEEDLRTALQRLQKSSVDSQEMWLLATLYDLAIDIGTMCGQGRVPTSPTIDEQEQAAGSTLTAELRRDAAFDTARSTLVGFDFRQPPDEVITRARSVMQQVAEAYIEALSNARGARDPKIPVDLVRDHSKNVLPFRPTLSMWDQQLRMVQQVNRQLGLVNHLAERQADLASEVKGAIGEVEAAEIVIERKRSELADLRAQEASRSLSGHFKALAKAER